MLLLLLTPQLMLQNQLLVNLQTLQMRLRLPLMLTPMLQSLLQVLPRMLKFLPMLLITNSELLLPQLIWVL